MSQLTILIIVIPTVLGSYFEWNRCDCDHDGTAAIAESLSVKFIQTNGQDASVSNNVQCNTDANRPDGCTIWLTVNHCVETGICGVGELCYNSKIFSSDMFSMNGQTYNKNDYPHSEFDLKHSQRCDSLCANYGWQAARYPTASYGYAIEGWGSEPRAC